jgi:hypothetical protein
MTRRSFIFAPIAALFARIAKTFGSRRPRREGLENWTVSSTTETEWATGSAIKNIGVFASHTYELHEVSFPCDSPTRYVIDGGVLVNPGDLVLLNVDDCSIMLNGKRVAEARRC